MVIGAGIGTAAYAVMQQSGILRVSSFHLQLWKKRGNFLKNLVIGFF